MLQQVGSNLTERVFMGNATTSHTDVLLRPCGMELIKKFLKRLDPLR